MRTYSTFIRFVVGTDRQDPRWLNGPFTEVEHLRKNGLLEKHEVTIVDNVFERYNEELPVPPWYNKWPPNAVSWFKDSAQYFISQMYDLVAILKEHGIEVHVLKTKTLSKILYEDEFQVVAADKRY